MEKLRVFLLACIAILCGSAHAQTPADLRRMGWEIFEAPMSGLPAGARSIFEVAETGLRHRASRVVCPTELHSFTLSTVAIVPVTASRPTRGDDIQCTYTTSSDPRVQVSMHVSTAVFPSALQSLQITVEALSRLNSEWLGWPINMAPAEFGGQNLAMTRGTILGLVDPSGIKLELASDIWIASVPHDTRFWEIKIRPTGEAQMRPQFDRFATTLLANLIDAAGRTTPGPVLPDQSGLLRWANPQSAESSLLIHVPSGLGCPAPPQGTVRHSLILDQFGFRCRYGSDAALWTVRVARMAPTQQPTPEEALRNIARRPNAPMRWTTLEAQALDGHVGAYAQGSVSVPPRTESVQFRAAHVNGYSLTISVSGLDQATLPSRAEVEQFALAIPQAMD